MNTLERIPADEFYRDDDGSSLVRFGTRVVCLSVLGTALIEALEAGPLDEKALVNALIDRLGPPGQGSDVESIVSDAIAGAESAGVVRRVSAG